MAGGGLFLLLDDLAVLLDDIAVMSKVAAQKTAGIAGDDLAVGAQGVVGLDPKRELPVIWEVAKGSAKNKAWLIPAALGLSIIAPWAITPIMMAGGAFLCYEGLEKVLHAKTSAAEHGKLTAAMQAGEKDLVKLEKDKIKKAIKTDTILSAEIVVITLGAVAGASMAVQVGTLVAIGFFMTVGIYGLVAGIVKLDDLGLKMTQIKGDGFFPRAGRRIGQGLLTAAPKIMKTLSVVGTAAMFVVGGEILMHGIPALEGVVHNVAHAISGSGIVQGAIGMLGAAVTGIAAGAAAVGLHKVLEKPFKKIAEVCTPIIQSIKKKLLTRRAKAQPEKSPSPGISETPAAESVMAKSGITDEMNEKSRKPETSVEEKPAPQAPSAPPFNPGKFKV
jgi:predicted DNA repair protein MutK